MAGGVEEEEDVAQAIVQDQLDSVFEDFVTSIRRELQNVSSNCKHIDNNDDVIVARPHAKISEIVKAVAPLLSLQSTHSLPRNVETLLFKLEKEIVNEKTNKRKASMMDQYFPRINMQKKMCMPPSRTT